MKLQAKSIVTTLSAIALAVAALTGARYLGHACDHARPGARGEFPATLRGRGDVPVVLTVGGPITDTPAIHIR